MLVTNYGVKDLTKHFTCITSLIIPPNKVSVRSSLSPLHTRGSGGLERSSTLPKGTQLVSIRTSSGTFGLEVHASNQHPVPQGFLAGGTFARGDVQPPLETFQLSQLEVGGGYWHLWAEARGATRILKCTGRPPRQRLTKPQMAIMSTLRNPALLEKERQRNCL